MPDEFAITTAVSEIFGQREAAAEMTETCSGGRIATH
jgi:hypothetical protein